MAQHQENNTFSSSSSDLSEHLSNTSNDDQMNASPIFSDLDTATTATSAVTNGLAACVMRTLAARVSGSFLQKAMTILYFVTVLGCRMLLKSSYAENLDETTTACLQDLLALAPFVVGLVLLSRGRDHLLRPKPPPSPALNSREPRTDVLPAPAAAEAAPVSAEQLGPENLKLYLFAM